MSENIFAVVGRELAEAPERDCLEHLVQSRPAVVTLNPVITRIAEESLPGV